MQDDPYHNGKCVEDPRVVRVTEALPAAWQSAVEAIIHAAGGTALTPEALLLAASLHGNEAPRPPHDALVVFACLCSRCYDPNREPNPAQRNELMMREKLSGCFPRLPEPPS